MVVILHHHVAQVYRLTCCVKGFSEIFKGIWEDDSTGHKVRVSILMVPALSIYTTYKGMYRLP